MPRIAVALRVLPSAQLLYLPACLLATALQPLYEPQSPCTSKQWGGVLGCASLLLSEPHGDAMRGVGQLCAISPILLTAEGRYSNQQITQSNLGRLIAPYSVVSLRRPGYSAADTFRCRLPDPD